jgi:hypothetical protein
MTQCDKCGRVFEHDRPLESFHSVADANSGQTLNLCELCYGNWVADQAKGQIPT